MGKILVAYASKFGSTAEIARMIAEELSQVGKVDLGEAGSIKNLDGYDAVVLGGPVMAGKWNKALPGFLKRHSKALAALPVAYFVSCLTMIEDSEANRTKTIGYIKPFLEEYPEVKPVDIGLFAGCSDHVSFPLKLMLQKITGQKPADFRDPEAIRAWAGGLHLAIQGGVDA